MKRSMFKSLACTGLAAAAFLMLGCNNPPPPGTETPGAAKPPSMTGATGAPGGGAPLAVSSVAPDGKPLAGLAEWKDKKNPEPDNEASAATAKASFAKNCTPCHGPEGKGDGPLVATFASDPNKPRNFTLGQFKYGSEDWQVMRTVWEGVSGTQMAGWKGRLPEKEAWDLVHYVKGLGGKK